MPLSSARVPKESYSTTQEPVVSKSPTPSHSLSPDKKYPKLSKESGLASDSLSESVASCAQYSSALKSSITEQQSGSPQLSYSRSPIIPSPGLQPINSPIIPRQKYVKRISSSSSSKSSSKQKDFSTPVYSKYKKPVSSSSSQKSSSPNYSSKNDSSSQVSRSINSSPDLATSNSSLQNSPNTGTPSKKSREQRSDSNKNDSNAQFSRSSKSSPDERSSITSSNNSFNTGSPPQNSVGKKPDVVVPGIKRIVGMQPLPVGGFSAFQLFELIGQANDVISEIPRGPKDNSYCLIDNRTNKIRKNNNLVNRFPDDMGSWESEKGSISTSYFLRNQGFKNIFKRSGIYGCFKTKKRVFVPLEPQPVEADVVVLKRYYTSLKRQPNFRRKVIWFYQEGNSNLPDVAYVEYCGVLHSFGEVHGNAKRELSHYKR